MLRSSSTLCRQSWPCFHNSSIHVARTFNNFEIKQTFRAYVFYGSFGYAYLGDGFNYSDHFVDLPLNTSITVLMFFCYFWIYVCVHRSNRVASVTSDEMSKRRAKEVKFATQFSVIASVLACKC
jgi:hypothetical protein